MSGDPHHVFMQVAIEAAQKAGRSGEVPVGAVMVFNDTIIAAAGNSVETDHNPLSHAETKAIQLATQIKKNWRLTSCSLYVTLEPCPMCLGALFQARVGRLYFGCPDPKRVTGGSVFPSLAGERMIVSDNNHNLKVRGGILEKECADLLKVFFRERRSSV